MPWRKCGCDSRWALFRVPNESVRQHTSRDVSQRHGSFRARRQDVGKPGIPRVSGTRDRRFKSGHPDFDCGGTRVGTGRRLLTALTRVRFLPPQLRDTEGQADHEYMVPGRWQPPRKRSSDKSTTLRAVPGVRLPHLLPCAPVADRQRLQPSKLAKRVRFRAPCVAWSWRSGT